MRKRWSLFVFSILALMFQSAAIFGAENGGAGLTPYQKNSVITGKIDATKSCTETSDRRNPELWLSIGQILLYQVEVPVNGNYEFHVVPGKYDLVATNSGGCLAQAEVKVEPKQVAQVNLRLASSRAPASK